MPFEQPGVHTEKFLWADVACIGVRWLASLVTCAEEAASTTSGALHAVANCIGMDANYRRERQEFAASMGMVIEQITGEASAS
jgi:hypothetical protein